MTGSAPDAVRTGGEWVAAALAAEGVSHVFGIPGIHNLAVYDALLGQPGITHVLARHEQGAGFMADGYARASGRPGVVLVTTGPGATNVLTPMAEAYASSVPLVTLMSDLATADLGRETGALHEVPDQLACFRPVARHAELVRSGGRVFPAVRAAFAALARGRPGPVAVSFPHDVLTGRAAAMESAPAPRDRPRCDPALVARAVELLGRARRPLLVAGGGVVASGGEAELERLARRLGAPVVTTVMGRGTLPEDDPLWQGVLPDRLRTEEALRAADVVLAVGCRFAARSTRGLLLQLEFSADQALIQLDLDPGVIGRMFTPTLGIVGDAREGLGRIVAALGPDAPASGWDRAGLAAARARVPARMTAEVAGLVAALGQGLARDAIVVNDQCCLNYWLEWRLPIHRSRTFLYPIGSATLGYALPAAIGAQVAAPGRQVVAVLGDGGFLFAVGELATAVKYNLPIAIVLLNDQRYGAIEWLQERLFGRATEAALANPDFPALARAFGAAGERLGSAGDLPEALERAARAKGPTLLEVAARIEPPWELGAR